MNDPLPLVIANLKANKTWKEVDAWLEVIGPKLASFSATIIVCPAYPFLTSASQKIQSAKLPIKLGSQDISRFEQGAYTGEVAASQISDLCQYAIIGHSERRRNFHEDNDTLSQKVKNARQAQITPIFCVQGPDTKIPEGAEIIAYEPVFAIGTGNPDTPQNAQNVAREIKQRKDIIVIYGGSVTGQNIKSFLQKGTIDGVLVGTKSLNPQDFVQITKNANY